MKLRPLLVEFLKLFLWRVAWLYRLGSAFESFAVPRVLEVLPPHIKVRVEDKIGRKCRGNAVDLSWHGCLPHMKTRVRAVSLSLRMSAICHLIVTDPWPPPSFPGAFLFPSDEQGQLFYDYGGVSSLCK